MLSNTSSNSAEWPPVRETAYTLKDLSQLILDRSSLGSAVRGLRRANDRAVRGGVLTIEPSGMVELELLRWPWAPRLSPGLLLASVRL